MCNDGSSRYNFIACFILWKGNFKNPKETNFLYFRFTYLVEEDVGLSCIERNGSRLFGYGSSYI